MIQDNRQVLFEEINSKSDHDPGCYNLLKLYGNNLTGFTPEIQFDLYLSPEDISYLVVVRSLFDEQILVHMFPPEQVPRIVSHLHKIGFFALKRREFIKKTDELISDYIMKINDLKNNKEMMISLLQSPEGIKNDNSF